MDLEALFKWLKQPNVIRHTHDCALNDPKRNGQPCSCRRSEVLDTIERMTLHAAH